MGDHELYVGLLIPRVADKLFSWNSVPDSTTVINIRPQEEYIHRSTFPRAMHKYNTFGFGFKLVFVVQSI